MKPDHTPQKFLRLPQVRDLTGVSSTTLWRWERAGTFPPRVQIGPNTVAWRESDIQRWMAEPYGSFSNNQHLEDE